MKKLVLLLVMAFALTACAVTFRPVGYPLPPYPSSSPTSYDPQIHGYILPVDPCGFARFPYIPDPTRWYPGYMIQCRNQRTDVLYDKWVPDHYE